MKKIVVVDYRVMQQRMGSMQSENATLKADAEKQKQESKSAEALLKRKQQELQEQREVVLKELELALDTGKLNGLEKLHNKGYPIGDVPSAVAPLLKELALSLKVSEVKVLTNMLGSGAESVWRRVNLKELKDGLFCGFQNRILISKLKTTFSKRTVHMNDPRYSKYRTFRTKWEGITYYVTSDRLPTVFCTQEKKVEKHCTELAQELLKFAKTQISNYYVGDPHDFWSEIIGDAGKYGI